MAGVLWLILSETDGIALQTPGGCGGGSRKRASLAGGDREFRVRRYTGLRQVPPADRRRLRPHRHGPLNVGDHSGASREITDIRQHL